MRSPGDVARGESSPSTSDLGKASTGGIIGSVASALSGVPGLGALGAYGGALADRDTAVSIGRQRGLTSQDTGFFDPTKAAVAASSFGLAGQSMQSQLGHAINSQTARNAFSSMNQAFSSKPGLSAPSLVPTQVGPPLSRTATPATGSPGPGSGRGSAPGSSASGFGGASGVQGPGTAGAPAGTAHGETSRGANTAGAGGTGSGAKVVCTAMCEAYGFGRFRQTIWLEHSVGLHPAYQRGYHRIFIPLVRRAYSGSWAWLRPFLEFVAKARTKDILAQRRGRRYIPGLLARWVLEPICFLVGLPK